MRSQISLEFLVLASIFALAFAGVLGISQKVALGEDAVERAEELGNSHILGSARNLGVPFSTELLENSTAPETFESFERKSSGRGVFG